MKKLVVVTDCDFEDVDIERKILERVDAELRSYNCEDEDDVIEIVDEAHAVINQYAPITRRVIECLSDSCVAIGQYGIGVDTIDVAAATEKGIVVVNVPSYCEDEVAEHALALLLTLARKLPSYDLEVRRLGWDWKAEAPIHRLSNRTLGLIGFGRIARRLAAKTQGLFLEVVAFDPYVKEAVMASTGVRKVNLETLLRSADLVSVHVPLTEETQNLLSDREFTLMKRDAIIVNVSRGPVIDQDALYEALCQRKLGAAGLDVLYEEPPRAGHSGKGLLNLENVCLTPHVAWYSEESVVELRKRLAGDIARVLQGKDPEGFVNPEVRLHPL